MKIIFERKSEQKLFFLLNLSKNFGPFQKLFEFFSMTMHPKYTQSVLIWQAIQYIYVHCAHEFIEITK